MPSLPEGRGLANLPAVLRRPGTWLRAGLFLTGLGAGLGAGVLYYAQTPQGFHSSARIVVEPRQPGGTTSDAPAPIDEALSTQALLLRSRALIERAVARHQLQSLPSLAGTADPVAAIAAGLSVDAGPQAANQAGPLDLTYRGAVAEDCATVLDALIDSYAEYLTQKTAKEVPPVESLLERTAALLKQELEHLEAEQRTERERVARLSREPAAPPRSAALEARKALAHNRQAEIRTTLERVEQASQQGPDAALAVVQVPGLLPKHDPAPGLEEVILALLRIEEETLLQGFDAEHPRVQATRQKIAEVRRYFTERLQSAAVLPVPQPGQSAPELLAMYVRSLRQELEDQQLSESAFAALLDQENETAKRLEAYPAKDEALRRQIARMREVYADVCRQREALALARTSRGRGLRVVGAPTVAEAEGPEAAWIFAGAGCLGVAFGTSLSLLVRFWK